MSFVIFFLQQVLLFTAPIVVAGMAGMYCERSGIINIGLEGNMIIGAFVGTVFLHFNPELSSNQGTLLVALLLSGLAGIAYSLLHGIASIKFKANQAVCGIALNMAAPALAIFLAKLLAGSQQVSFSNDFRIEKIPILGDIPIIGDILFCNVYITFFVAVAIFIVSAIVLKKTRFGMRVRACGENPSAADSVGINVARIRYLAVIICGFFAGIAGTMFIIPTTTEYNASVAGYGFIAVSAIILGRWNPGRILVASIFFGFTKTLAAVYSAIPFLAGLGIDAFVFRMIPFVATIVVLAITSTRNNGEPAALGIPYDKGSR